MHNVKNRIHARCPNFDWRAIGAKTSNSLWAWINYKLSDKIGQPIDQVWRRLQDKIRGDI